MPKRSRENSEERKLRKKIKKYQEKLKRKQRLRSFSTSSESAATPPPAPAAPLQDDDILVTTVLGSSEGEDIPVAPETTNNKENEDHVLDEDILHLLGDAPQEEKFGPPIHKELATRWINIVKNGLSKDKRNEIKKSYLPPENCKHIDAPKLNLEAKAAVAEASVKRDKAIASKQNQIGCALTSLARAFGELSKNKENIPTLNNINDAAQLLCDIQYQENLTRRNFILQGLEQTIKDAVKDTEVDQWLFGESFSDKLKASKAIKKSGQEISLSKKKQQYQTKPLNYKGPVNPPRSRAYQPGPHRSYQNYKKPTAQSQSAPQAAKTQSSHKPPPKRN